MGSLFKSPKSKPPEIPPELRGVFQDASARLSQALGGGATPFQGQMSAQFGPQFQRAISGFNQFSEMLADPFQQAIGGLLGIGQTGGLTRGALDVTQQALDPLFSQQRNLLRSDIRAGQAARGNFFSTGGQTGEAFGLGNLAAQQGGQVLGGALSTIGNRLGAFGQIAGLQAGIAPQSLQFAMAQRQPGAEAAQREFELFQLTRPEAFIGAAGSLLGATPLAQQQFGPSLFENLLGAGATFFGGPGGAALFNRGGKGKGDQ